MCKVHIDLQEFQVFLLMLYRMVFTYLVRRFPYMWILVLQKLMYVIKVVQFLFFPD